MPVNPYVVPEVVFAGDRIVSWFRGALIAAGLLIPAVRATDPAGAQVMGHLVAIRRYAVGLLRRFAAERLHWIDARRTGDGHEAGRGGDAGQQQCDRTECKRIERRHAVEQRAHQPGR
jgi:hypothetical protein